MEIAGGAGSPRRVAKVLRGRGDGGERARSACLRGMVPVASGPSEMRMDRREITGERHAGPARVAAVPLMVEARPCVARQLETSPGERPVDVGAPFSRAEEEV
jgi:hypothetical protein